jgi:hypothetical protein
MRQIFPSALLALALSAPTLHAQQMDMSSMPGMQMNMPMSMSANTLIEAEMNHASSGTSIEPASTPASMLMTSKDGWMLMLHGQASLVDTQQSGPRGRDKLYSPNWIMPMAMHSFGPGGRNGQLTVRAMFSLEPATMTGREFPELFQQGETAFGTPIIDGQHPHDFLMELAALYDLKLGAHTLLSLYGAPVGDPAIGPTAYPHRLSASEDPIAALSHHQQDSTHIAFNVLTAGLTYRGVRIEESGFHGAEPTEAHWHFQPSPNGLAIDSYATRITVSPTRDWTGQYSIAHLNSPEQLYPREDQQRQTASIMYNRAFAGSNNWSNTIVWGRAKSLADNSKENSYLLESLLRFRNRNYVWTRMENAGRSNELALTPGSALPAGFEEAPLGHVAAYTFGYDRDFYFLPHIATAPGIQVTSYTTPGPLVAQYGAHPVGVQMFVRFRIHQ